MYKRSYSKVDIMIDNNLNMTILLFTQLSARKSVNVHPAT